MTISKGMLAASVFIYTAVLLIFIATLSKASGDIERAKNIAMECVGVAARCDDELTRCQAFKARVEYDIGHIFQMLRTHVQKDDQ